jgi:hypothetical protein
MVGELEGRRIAILAADGVDRIVREFADATAPAAGRRR